MADPSRLALIRRLQGERSQNEFARFLGISESHLSRVMTGERGANLVLIQIMTLFPEHANEIAAALASSTPVAEQEALAVPA